MNKLYVVTRADMGAGDQLAQSVHAATEIAFRYGKQPWFTRWFVESNTVVCLAVENEGQLNRLVEQLMLDNVDHSTFEEPDMNGALTAIAFIAPEGYLVRKSRLSPR